MHVTDYPLWMLPVAALGGLSFSFLGIGYRLGQNKNIRSEPIGAIAGLAGVTLFLVESGASSIFSVPPVIWLTAILIGVSQFLLVKLVKVALDYGPLSPLWCAVSLQFVPIVIFSHFAFREFLGALHYVGLIAATACVSLGAIANNKNSKPVSAESRDKHAVGKRNLMIYGVILIVVLLGNSIAGMAVKYLGMTKAIGDKTLMDQYGGQYLFWFYTAFALALWSNVARIGRTSVNGNWRYASFCGLVSGGGSVGGMLALRACVAMPAATMFTIVSIMSILGAAVFGTLHFGEKRSPAWYGMLAAGIATVLLFNGTEILERANAGFDRNPSDALVTDTNGTCLSSLNTKK